MGASQSLAELVPTNPEYDSPAQLALSYDVVDLVAMAAEDLPRSNLITWVAEVELSRRAGEDPTYRGSRSKEKLCFELNEAEKDRFRPYLAK